MGILEAIGFKTGSTSGGAVAIENIFPLKFTELNFVTRDVTNIYARILTDVFERTSGLKSEHQKLLWDNCVKSEKSDGLVTLLAKAMESKGELFLIYKKELNVVRAAEESEKTAIKEAYKNGAQVEGQVYVSFSNYDRTDFMKLYSTLEYSTIASLYKQLNLAKAVFFKMANLRGSVGFADADSVIAQAQAVALALREGKDSLIDAADVLEMLKPDLAATKSSLDFVNQKQSFYLGLPASYITGLAPKGLGDSGIGDAKAVERGLKGYYFAIGKPVVEALFGGNTEFRSDDYDRVNASLELMKTMEATSEELVSIDEKRVIVRRALGLNEKMSAKDLKALETPDPKADPKAGAVPKAEVTV